ncbi:uncharacterized protein LOC101858853 [Aplysia californica]|uniref:Uncharacterized protein LOC101858853 n=1 Tax=Aplysia californica TaxID=6500 RepID=A0ABM0JK95_APLCA|nr:uncharacterized protein LOC101858853 [Aplysia californica]
MSDAARSGSASEQEDPPNEGMMDQESWAEFAEMARETQGAACEMDLALEGAQGEGFDQLLLKKCKKYPGHHDFIPLHDLDLQRLPEGYRRPDILEYVKCLANRTVKLIVRYTSPDRPDEFGWTTLKGKKTPRCGSGEVYMRYQQDSKSDQIEIIVTTAVHVVYDEEEIKETTVELFYDRDSDRSSVIRARGDRQRMRMEERDKMVFYAQLSRRHFPDLKERIRPFNVDLGPISNLAICVSHPHGVAKRVTFGSLKTKKELEGLDLNPGLRDDFLPFLSDIETSLLLFEEKKVLYYTMYCSKLTNTITETSRLGISPSEQRRIIMKHLVNKGLLKCPSDDEVMDINEQLKDRLRVTTETFLEMFEDNEYILGESNPATAPQAAAANSAPEASENIQIPQSVSDQTFQDNFVKRQFELEREFSSKRLEFELEGGLPVQGWVQFYNAKYYLPTCPGSSGAAVICCFEMDGETHKMALPHSRSPADIGQSLDGVLINPLVNLLKVKQ